MDFFRPNERERKGRVHDKCYHQVWVFFFAGWILNQFSMKMNEINQENKQKKKPQLILNRLLTSQLIDQHLWLNHTESHRIVIWLRRRIRLFDVRALYMLLDWSGISKMCHYIYIRNILGFQACLIMWTGKTQSGFIVCSSLNCCHQLRIGWIHHPNKAHIFQQTDINKIHFDKNAFVI